MEFSDTAPQTIVTHNVVHLRAEPRSGAEMVSQTLMGHTVRVLRRDGAWSYVQTDDAYRGWCETRWLCDDVSPATLSHVSTVFAEARREPAGDAPLVMRVSIASGVSPGAETTRDGWASVTLFGNDTKAWVPASDFAPLPTPAPADVAKQAAALASDFLGTPYLWGGSSSFGLDCSGLVQLCYRLAGVVLRRDADIQRDDVRFVPVSQAELLPGDLVFFGKPDKITHVGMHFAGDTFIHSAGGAGVILTEWGDDRYSPGFVDARRLDPARAHEPVLRFEADDR